MKHINANRTLSILLLLGWASMPALTQNNTASATKPEASIGSNANQSSPNPPFIVDPSTGQPISLDPATGWTEIMSTAKTAEEGDADLKTASSHYESIIRIFLKLRPIAAEALHRYSAVEKKRDHAAESQEAERRLREWFPDLPQYSQPFQDPGTPSAAAASAPPSTIATVTAGGTEYRMDPKLMARYGLLAPARSTGGGAAATKAPSAAAPSTDNFERTQLIQQRSMLLAEASRTSAELRRVRQELTRVAGQSPSSIPPQLVSDPKLRLLIENISDPIDRSKVLHIDPDTNHEMHEKRKLQQVKDLHEYFESHYLPRLQTSLKVLEREMVNIETEASQVDAALAKRSW